MAAGAAGGEVGAAGAVTRLATMAARYETPSLQGEGRKGRGGGEGGGW